VTSGPRALRSLASSVMGALVGSIQYCRPSGPTTWIVRTQSGNGGKRECEPCTHVETAWEPIGGKFSSLPAVASWGSNRLDIVGRGIANGNYHKA
jgi:hypothetical protein